MKKYIAIVIAMLMVVSCFAACAGNTNTDTEGTDAAIEATDEAVESAVETEDETVEVTTLEESTVA